MSRVQSPATLAVPSVLGAASHTPSPRSPLPLSSTPHPRPPTSSTATRRDASYTPLLTTIHMRHSMMRERIEQRWLEVNEQLTAMRKELRHRRRQGREQPTRAQTAKLLGVEGVTERMRGEAGKEGMRRDMAIAAARAVDEGRLTTPDVLDVRAGEEERKEGDRPLPSPNAAAEAKRRERRMDGFTPPSFGLADVSPDDPPSSAPSARASSSPDAYARHLRQWERDTLRPVLEPDPSPSASSAPQQLTLTLPPPEQSPSSSSTQPSAPPPLTPRHAYSVYLSSTIKNLVALLMQLDKTAMSSIRTSFSHHPAGLDLYTFVLMAMTYMRSCVGSREDVAALIEMFRDIDVNGDEVMEWEEFTSHLVQLASTYGEDTTSSQLPHFTPAVLEDTSSHERVVDAVRYVPGLKKLVLFERNSRRFKVYSCDMKALATVRGHRAPLLCCEYWDKGGMLMTASGDKTLIFWAVVNATNAYTMNMSWALPASYVALRYAGGHTLFAADTNHLITQWHLERSEQRCVYRGHTDVVMDMAVLHHYNLLASCSLDTTVRLWDIGKGVEVSIMKGHTRAATLLAYHPDLKLLISAGLDRFALVWNPRVLAPVYTIQCASPLAHIVGLEVLAGSPELVVGDSKGCFMVYDLRSFSVIQQFSIPTLQLEQSLHSFTVVHSAGLLIAAAAKLYQFKRTTGVRRHHADDNAVRFAAFNATRLSFITVASDNIKLWNALTGMLEREEKHFTKAGITSACVDDLQRRIYVGCTDGSLYCLKYSSGAIIQRMQVHRTEVSAMAYHANTKGLVSGSWDASVCLSDDKLTAVSKRTHAHTEDVLHLATSATYHLIASAAADMSISLHDTHLGPPLVKWHVEQLPSAMVFLDPYPLLLVADHSGGLAVFDVTTPFRRSVVWYVKGFSRVMVGEGLAVGKSLRRAGGRVGAGRERGEDGGEEGGEGIGLEWEVGEGTEGSHSSVINGLCFVPSSSTLYTGDDAGYLKAWQLHDSLLAPFHMPKRRRSSIKVDQHAKAGVAGEEQKEEGEEEEDGPAAPPPLTRFVSMMTASRQGCRGEAEGEEGSGRSSTFPHSDPPPPLPAKPIPLPSLSPAPNKAEVPDEWDDDEGVRPAINPADCRLLTPALLSTLPPLSPHLVCHAHSDSCSGVSYIALSLPHPSLLSYSFDGSVVLTSVVTGRVLGALMQGHNSRNEEREGGREWRWQYDLVHHRMKELEMMRDGLSRAGKGMGVGGGGGGAEGEGGKVPGWVREEGEAEEGDADDADALTVDRRMLTPQRALRARPTRGHPSTTLPPLVSHAGQRVGKGGGVVHVERPSAAGGGGHGRPATGARLWVGGSYVQLSEGQAVAVDRLERVMKGEVMEAVGEGGEEEKEQLRERERRLKGKVGRELVKEFGNWERSEQDRGGGGGGGGQEGEEGDGSRSQRSTSR